MTGWPKVLAKEVGLRKPTVDASRELHDAVMPSAGRRHQARGNGPPTEPTARLARKTGKVGGVRCRARGSSLRATPRGPDPGRLRGVAVGNRAHTAGRDVSGETATRRRPGSGHADNEPALREFPLDPLPLRGAADSRHSYVRNMRTARSDGRRL